jgi:translin
MESFDQIGEEILAELARQDRLREEALSLSRGIIRSAARSIRAIHRGEFPKAEKLLTSAQQSIIRLEEITDVCPLFSAAGYISDAQKEYAEGWITFALIRGDSIPHPKGLRIPMAPYMNALGEAVGELRRSILDLLRQDDISPCETRLESMQQIYDFLATVDFPDALTGRLRRTTDIVRRILESTRADLTTALRQQKLQAALSQLEKKL